MNKFAEIINRSLKKEGENCTFSTVRVEICLPDSPKKKIQQREIWSEDEFLDLL
jgi:hypothetical protein